MTATAPSESKGPAVESITAIAAKSLGMNPLTATEQQVREEMARRDRATKPPEFTSADEWEKYAKIAEKQKVFKQKGAAKGSMERAKVVHVFPQLLGPREDESVARFTIETFTEGAEPKWNPKTQTIDNPREAVFILAKDFLEKYEQADD